MPTSAGRAAGGHNPCQQRVGTVECAWPDQGRTECKVGANQVTVCGIECESSACPKANRAPYDPVWPLTGGPKSAPAN